MRERINGDLQDLAHHLNVIEVVAERATASVSGMPCDQIANPWRHGQINIAKSCVMKLQPRTQATFDLWHSLGTPTDDALNSGLLSPPVHVTAGLPKTLSRLRWAVPGEVFQASNTWRRQLVHPKLDVPIFLQYVNSPVCATFHAVP